MQFAPFARSFSWQGAHNNIFGVSRDRRRVAKPWLAKLKEVRAANNILASDECAWVTGGASGTTCSEHFGFDM